MFMPTKQAIEETPQDECQSRSDHLREEGKPIFSVIRLEMVTWLLEYLHVEVLFEWCGL